MQIDEVIRKINATYPDRDWDQWCQRLIWNVIYFAMGYTNDSQVVTYGSAAAARRASRIESPNASKAPVGAIHYWGQPADGHVGVSLGGSRVLMTGTPAALGAGGVQAYSSARNDSYVGWSRTNGANTTLIGRLTVPGGSTGGTNATKDQWRTIQAWLRRLGRYTGPVDGVPGPNTWKGVQKTVAKYGYYHGPIDGVPGINTYKGMQSYARDGGGYTGPIDGVMGPRSWAGFVKRLSS